MSSETARRALRAAAKVAFGAAFIGVLPGCGGKAESSPEPGDSPVSGGAAGSAIAGGAAAGGAAAGGTSAGGIADAGGAPALALVCLGEVTLGVSPAPSPAVSASESACCAAYDSGRSASALDAGQNAELGSDPSFVNCCKAIIAGHDTGALTVDVGWPVINACCNSGIVAPSSDLWQHVLCSPWGPPVPPSLGFGLEALA